MPTHRFFFTRHITTQAKIYSSRNFKVTDYVFKFDKEDSAKAILNKVVEFTKQPEAILILTQPSAFLCKKGNAYIPCEITLKNLQEIKEKKLTLKPFPGHISAAIAKDNQITSELSFRPDNEHRILSREAGLHQTLFPVQAGHILASSFEKSFLDEVEAAANDLMKMPQQPLHLSIIEGYGVNKKLAGLIKTFDSIKSEQSESYLSVYNLCSGFIKTEELKNVTEQKFKKALSELIEQALYIIYPDDYNKDIVSGWEQGKVRIAAQACGHAICKALLNEGHLLEKTVGPDLSTQQYAAHIIARFIHDKNYLDHTPLLNATARVIDEIVHYRR